MGSACNRLLALPIPGESFLLQRHNKNILVDGGHSSRRLSAALRAKGVNVDQLDIVVCTHADIDHAGGLVDLLDKSAINVKEFWLPGEWIDGMPQLLQNPKAVVDSLIAELEQYAQDATHGSDDSYEIFEERPNQRNAQMKEESRDSLRYWLEPADQGDEAGYAGLRWLQELVEFQDSLTTVAENAKLFRSKCSAFRRRAKRLDWNSDWVTFGLSAIKTAERIRRIALQAVRHPALAR